MARKMSYDQKIAEHIRRIVGQREIEQVLHFTQLENFPTILEHGILPRSELMHSEFVGYASDEDRLDDNYGAVSVSISCYYPKMFEAKRYRSGNAPWAILILNPSILWSYHCLFYRQSVASRAADYERGKRYGGYALERLFEDCFLGVGPNTSGLRAQSSLPSSWPTFPDAEVQVMSSVKPEFIAGAVVETHEHGEYVRSAANAAGREDFEIEVHPFAPRLCFKPYFWG